MAFHWPKKALELHVTVKTDDEIILLEDIVETSKNVTFSALLDGRLYKKISKDDEKIVFHSILDEDVLLGKNRIYQAYEGGVRRLSFWQCRDMQDVEFRKDSSGEYRYTGDNREVDVRDNRHVQPPGLFQYVGYL